MSGYGNKAWRRAGCAVPDTRTQQRVDVVGTLTHKEWRKETPLKKKARATSAYRYFRRERSGTIRRYTNSVSQMWAADVGWEETAVHRSWAIESNLYAEITEHEARLMIPEAFVGVPIYFKIDGYGDHMWKYVNSITYWRHRRHNNWNENFEHEGPDWNFNPTNDRFTVITEQEAREFMPSAFED